MKALLVAMNAKYIHSNLGLYSIRAYALAHGIPRDGLGLAEYTINQSLEDIMSDIYQRQPEFLAFSCYIWNIRQIRELAVELHKILPEVPIWLGGPEVSYQPEQLLAECPWISGVMVGEGEVTFQEVYQAYALEGREQWKGIELSGIPGIVYWDSGAGEIVTTPPREPLPIDEIIFPYGNGEEIEGLEHRIIYYESSRGCPFNCSYCLSSVDRKVRLRSIGLVEQELQFFLDRKVAQVKFVDRTFNCQRQHTMRIWRYLYEHDNGVTNFHFELSADLLTEEEIEYIHRFRPGLAQFEIGVQSTNPDTLKAIRRVTDLAILKKRVGQIREGRNIHQHLDLIAGLPYEDYRSFRRSFNEVYAMRPDQLQLGFLKLLKGSPLFGEHKELGIVFQEKPPYEVLYTQWLPYRDVLRLKQVEDMVERYYNSMQFQASLPYVTGRFSTPFDFYQEIGAYYQEKGYAGIHSSRLLRYEILLEFYREKISREDHILRQLLLYDLYARENLKSRPAFLQIGQSSRQKEWDRKFYQDPSLRRQYLPDYEAYDQRQAARMTHLESFDFQVLDYLQEGILIMKKCIVLFDYQNRDPLTRQARVVSLSDDIIDI